MQPIEQEITELWGQITAATYRFLELLAEFDRSGRWGGNGLASCAQWLNIYCGIDRGSAREKVRVARALENLPKIRSAFRESRISYSKARAMTRVATPENEHILLDIALHGTAAHVEKTVRYFRKVERIEEAQMAAKAYRHRYIDFRCDDDEHIVIHGRLPVEVGELVRWAIERAMEQLETDGNVSDVSAETSAAIDAAIPEDEYPVGARRADALRHLASQYLASGAERSGASSDRYQVVVHIDQRLLTETSSSSLSVAPPGSGAGPNEHPDRIICELEDGPALAAATARRLACDGALVGMVDKEDGETLNVGRRTRAIPPALARALRARDRGCRFPGCTHTRFTEGHHVEHWADGGETKLTNLITLCHFHHHLVHEGGFGVERTDDGVFIFRNPTGDRLPEHVPAETCFRGDNLATLNRDRGVDIPPDICFTRWHGERMDYSIAIDCLLAARPRAVAGQCAAGHVRAP